MSGNHMHHLPHLVHKLNHSSDPKEGAVAGAAAASIGVPAALATVGLALTPLGWGVALLGGAAAGAAYVSKKFS